MPKSKIKLFKPDDNCPCESSGLLLKDCCLYDGKYLRKKIPNLYPPLPPTGYSHKSCYLSHTKDCSTKISGEHYVSSAVLKVIGKQVAVKGALWLTEDKTKIVGVNALTANVLCRRHNTSLSDLDNEALLFFKKLIEIKANLLKSSLSMRKTYFLLSGETFELWLLKVAYGFFYSKNAAIESIALKDSGYKVNQDYVWQALFNNIWQTAECGLYIKALLGQNISAVDNVTTAPIVSKSAKSFAGVQTAIGGVAFMLIFDPNAIDAKQLKDEGWRHRPTEINFSAQKRSHSIVFTWPPGTPEGCVRIQTRRLTK